MQIIKQQKIFATNIKGKNPWYLKDLQKSVRKYQTSISTEKNIKKQFIKNKYTYKNN